MDASINNSIKVRKDAIYDYYKVTDSELNNKISCLFSEIESFAEECRDAADFETKFADSELNQKYMNIFNELATKCTIKNVVKNQAEEYLHGKTIARDIKEEFDYRVESATQPLRHQAYQETMDKVRDIPVLKDVIQAKQTFDLFGKFKRNKDK